jgi:GT2 family glycosyltransferase
MQAPERQPKPAAVAVVAIGRNEGERLRRCIESVQGRVAWIVYVDSGSTDRSVEMAEARGVAVVRLDMSRPFTAARARNAGFSHLRAQHPHIDLVQFVDGDCEIEPGWIERAEGFLAGAPDVVAVFGRRRERYPDRSVYNHLCDMEWAVPPGDALACGGDVMMRVAALDAVRGYREDLIAGEEPELCVRLRARGGRIHCLGAPMTLHDAAMTSFRQWWLRIVRSGYAFAEGAHLHGAPPERHWVRESRRAWLWGLALPLAISVAMAAFGSGAALLALVYPLQVVRLFLNGVGSVPERALRAGFQVLGRFPEAVGQLRFVRNRLLQRRAALIEYK